MRRGDPSKLLQDSAIIESVTSYRLQLFQQGILRGSLFGRFGHMEVQRVSVPQSIQTQHKGYVILQQTGVWRGRRDNRSNQLLNTLLLKILQTILNNYKICFYIHINLMLKCGLWMHEYVRGLCETAERYLCGLNCPPASVWCPGS